MEYNGGNLFLILIKYNIMKSKWWNCVKCLNYLQRSNCNFIILVKWIHLAFNTLGLQPRLWLLTFTTYSRDECVRVRAYVWCRAFRRHSSARNRRLFTPCWSRPGRSDRIPRRQSASPSGLGRDSHWESTVSAGYSCHSRTTTPTAPVRQSNCRQRAFCVLLTAGWVPFT